MSVKYAGFASSVMYRAGSRSRSRSPRPDPAGDFELGLGNMSQPDNGGGNFSDPDNGMP